MTAQEVVDLLLDHHGHADFAAYLDRCRPHYTIDVIIALKQRVDSEKLRNAGRALHIAEVAVQVAACMTSPEATARAAWARGNALHYLRQGPEALACYRAAEHFFTGQAMHLEATILQVNQVGTLLEMGQLHEAIALAGRAGATCRELGDPARPYLALLEMNLGVAYRQLGDLDATLAAYARGRALFVALGDQVQTARMDINRAHALQEMDRFGEADALLHAARTVLAQTGHAQEVARADLNLGLLAYRRGHYQAALRHLETAHHGLEAIGNQVDVAFADLTRASIYRQLNLVQETIALATSAQRTFRQHSMPGYEVLALLNQAAAHRQLNALATAGRLLARARRIVHRQGAWRRVLELDLERAIVAFDEGRLARADRLARRVARAIDATMWPSLAARVHLLHARSALACSPADLATAQAAVTAALDVTTAHDLREEVWQAHHLRARLLAWHGDTPAAFEACLQAVAAIELWRSMLHVDEFQVAFMDDKLPAYLDAVRLGRHLVSPAALLYLLNLAQRAPLVQPDPYAGQETRPELADLETRATGLRETWHWEQSKLERLLAQPPQAGQEVDTQPGSLLVATHRRLHTIESELAELQRRMRVHAAPLTGYAPTSAGEGLPTGVADAFMAAMQQRLAGHEGLLTYYVVDGALHVLLVTCQAAHAIENLVPATVVQHLRQAWHLHLELVAARYPATDHLPLARAYLARFFQALVRPLVPLLAGLTHLYLVLPAGWHDLPFAGFFDGQQHLVERFQLTHLSAPEALLGLTAGETSPAPTSHPTALVVAHSDGGRLPATVAEASSVAALLARRWEPVLLLESEATREAVRAATRNCHLMHVAAHATFRPDNPLFSWVRLADTRLTVADLYSMTLPQRPLVVLSACETGRGQARGGGLLGMGRGFLAAGASGLVVSLWKAADEATGALMVEFYQNLLSVEGSDAAASLRQAQLAAMQRYHHAFFWAGFVYIRG